MDYKNTGRLKRAELNENDSIIIERDSNLPAVVQKLVVNLDKLS